MNQVHVIGLGVYHRELPKTITKLIENAEVLVGGNRLLEIFKDHPALKIPVQSPLDTLIKCIEEKIHSGKEVVILADGDPLFFGIGRPLIEFLGKEHVRIYPNVTTLQAAAARIKVPWENITTVSLHGRGDFWPLFRALVCNDWIAVFTDKINNPVKIAKELIKREVNAFRLHVFENLGQENERIRSIDLSEAIDMRFSPLCFILLERIKIPEVLLHLGLDDDLYHHEKDLITKKEIRAVGLSLLEIQPDHTVWDLGAGCGSVAIEASLLAHRGMVFAIERSPERVEQIRQNIQRTGAYIVEPVCGEMPGCLETLPEPDRIFMGGGMGYGNRVLEVAIERLKHGGKLVLHVVLIGSLARARDCLKSLGWPMSIYHVQLSRSRDLAGDQRLEALNPVYILCATKPR